MFHVAISKRKGAALASNPQTTVKSDEGDHDHKPQSSERKIEAGIEANVAVKHIVEEKTFGDVKITIKGGDCPFQISLGIASSVCELRSLFATELKRPVESIRFVYGGRVLKSEENLSEVMLHCRDKSSLTLHVLMSSQSGEVGSGKTNGSGINSNPDQGDFPSSSLGSAGVRGDLPVQNTEPIQAIRYEPAAASPGSGSGGATPPTRSPKPELGSPRSPSQTSQQKRQEGMLEILRKRLEVSMKQAFWDRLEETLKSESPDYDWICRLYGELGDRLCALTPKRSDVMDDTRAALDVELFSGMVRNQAVDVGDLRRIVSLTFSRLLSLCSPARDDEVKKSRDELERLLDSGSPELTFASFVVPFLKSFHQALDDIESDIAAFRSLTAPAGSANASPSQARVARSPSPGGSTQAARMSLEDVRARLAELGVPEEMVLKCVERRQLDSLLEDALRHQRLALSAALDKATEEGAAHLSASSGENRKDVSAVNISFRFGFGASSSAVELVLDRGLSIPQARLALSNALPDRPTPSRLQLVHAGRVLRDSDTVGDMCPAAAEASPVGAQGRSEAAAVVHVVVSKADRAAAGRAVANAAAVAVASEAQVEVTFRSRQVRLEPELL